MAKVQLTPEQYKAKAEKKAEKRKRFTKFFLGTIAICVAIVVVYSASTVAYTRIGLSSMIKKPATNVNAQTPSGDDSNVDWNTDVNNTPTPDTNDTPSTDTNNDNQQGGTTATVMTSKTMQFDLFVKAFNGVKTNAKSVTQLKKNAYNYDEHVDAGGIGIIETAGKGLMGSLLKAEETNLTFQGADIAANFPPSGATSGLTQKDIQSIDCKEEGDYYVITVVVKPAVNPTAGEKVGAVATILTKESIQDPIKNVPIINSLEPKCDYKATTAVAKIEKSTGNMVEYYFDLPMYLYMGDFSVGLGFEEWWTVAY
ncbi:MAG: hypothetical protein J6Q50_01560 [Clostridia bacterium]|nr:hypothetical protein [Clostridia bacterium]